MKTAAKSAKKIKVRTPAEFRFAWWHGALSAAAVFLCTLFVYSPALRGEFVFDDLHMPFVDPAALTWPIQTWWGVRPLLMTTFWLNLHLGGVNPYTYHLVNVVFHAGAGILLFFVLRKILQAAHVEKARLNLLAAFGAAVFLLHPIQTEAVAYVAQRGEDMGAFLYFASFCIFLYRKPGPLSWGRAIAVLTLFLAAVTTKEHTVTLPLLLLLTDYFWNPGFTFDGIRKNWRLYSLVGAGLCAGLAFVLHFLSLDKTSVGFSLPEFTAAQYLFTQFRVFFAYVGLFLFPLWQTIDYDFTVSRSVFDHGSIIGLVGILLLTAAALRYRRKFPLASYGFLVFGLLLLPTSSVVPIRDLIVDRRIYLPMAGLVLVMLEFLRRWKVSRGSLVTACAAICFLLATASYLRNEKWASAQALWADAAEKSPDKQRVQFGLAVSQFRGGHCRESIPHYERAVALGKPDSQLLWNLSLAYDCEHQTGKALGALRRSIELHATAESWASLGLIEAKNGTLDEALTALNKAEQLDPRYPNTYVYRGGIYQVIGRVKDAAEEYRRALAIDPVNHAALHALQSLGPDFAQPKA